jgi:polyhydroxyalkanoate synthase
MPSYIVATREDHIVPWRTAYQSTALLKGEARFVLGASGHIAGIINPASKNRRSYWASDAAPGPDADAWLAGAREHAGSWWSDWSAWLASHGGGKLKAKKSLGGHGRKALEPAPGLYAKQRVV